MTDIERAEEALKRAHFYETNEVAEPDGYVEFRRGSPHNPTATDDVVRLFDDDASVILNVPFGQVAALLSPALTEEERDALRRAIYAYENDPNPDYDMYAEAKSQQVGDIDILRSILSRYGGDTPANVVATPSAPANHTHYYEDCPDMKPGDAYQATLGPKGPCGGPNVCPKCFFRMRDPQPWLYVNGGDTP